MTTRERPVLDRPWTRWYAERGLGPLQASPDLVTMAAAAVAAAPDRVALQYYDWTATHAELAALADGFAAYLAGQGVSRGDRVAICLQASPHFFIAALGAWKAGAVVVTVNSMYREAEAAHLLSDSGAIVVVASHLAYRSVLEPVLPGTSVRVSVTTSEIDVLAMPDPRVLAGLTEQPVDGTDDLMAVARAHADRRFEAVPPRPDDVAVLCYTSGTTGPAKGAMLTHANIATTIALNSQVARHRAGRCHLRHGATLPRRRARSAVGAHPAPGRDARAALPDHPRGDAGTPHGVPAAVRRLPPDRVPRAHGGSRGRAPKRSRRWTCCMPAAPSCRPPSSTASRNGSASTSTTGTG